MMGAGNACSTLYKLNPNDPTGGGNKKQGLVSHVGVGAHVNRDVSVGANSSKAGRETLFVQNQLSGVTSSEFGRGYARADGVKAQTASSVAQGR